MGTLQHQHQQDIKPQFENNHREEMKLVVSDRMDTMGIDGKNTSYQLNTFTALPFSPSNRLGLGLVTTTTLFAVELLAVVLHRTNGSALAADSLLEELRLELTMLVVAVRLLDRDGNGVEDVCGLLEDGVHLFQGAVARLGEEEVHGGEHKCVAAIVSSCSVPKRLGGYREAYITAKIM